MSTHPVLHLLEDAEEKLSSALRKFTPPFCPRDRESILDSCHAFGDRLRVLALVPKEIARRRLKVLRGAYGTREALPFEIRVILDTPVENAVDTVGAASVPSKTKVRGRRANVDVNRAVARLMESFGPNWTGHLDEICDALDQEKVLLPKSDKWKRAGCKDWRDVGDTDREGLVKALSHRVDWASKHPVDSSELNHAANSIPRD